MRRKIVIRRGFLLLWALAVAAAPLRAQIVKEASVAQGVPYTDHVSLAEDSRDTDLMVKFVFDEQKNTLTVSLLSYRGLFVFREATRYKTAVCGRRLHPDRLPYVASFDPDTRFKFSKELKRSLPRPHGAYVFRRWIEYEGLQPAPADYKMVNDYIEQRFDILQKQSLVTVTLRDVFLMEPSGNTYLLLDGKDLNTRYQVTIRRNPCFGLDQEVELARNACAEVKSAYQGFRKNYADGEVPDQEALDAFEKTRQLLLTQFPVKNDVTACPDLSQAIQEYNQYVDSIGRFSCILHAPEDAVSWDDGKPLDVKLLYTQTRQLDKSVARWLVSKDSLERQDLVSQCMDIVKDVTAMIRQHRISTPEEQKAVQAYRQAEEYFRKTCKP